jgi:DNA-binding NarL/FixJ family response regulator
MNINHSFGHLRDCVLIVDDDAMIADLWCMTLEDMGLEVCGSAATAAEAIDLARAHRPWLVLMDVRLRGEPDGIDAAIAIHASVECQVIFITCSSEPSTAQRMQACHPAAVLIKPVSDRQLQSAITTAIRTIMRHKFLEASRPVAQTKQTSHCGN